MEKYLIAYDATAEQSIRPCDLSTDAVETIKQLMGLALDFQIYTYNKYSDRVQDIDNFNGENGELYCVEVTAESDDVIIDTLKYGDLLNQIAEIIAPSVTEDYAFSIAEKLCKRVKEDLIETADENYNTCDIEYAIGRVLDSMLDFDMGK